MYPLDSWPSHPPVLFTESLTLGVSLFFSDPNSSPRPPGAPPVLLTNNHLLLPLPQPPDLILPLTTDEDVTFGVSIQNIPSRGHPVLRSVSPLPFSPILLAQFGSRPLKRYPETHSHSPSAASPLHLPSPFAGPTGFFRSIPCPTSLNELPWTPCLPAAPAHFLQGCTVLSVPTSSPSPHLTPLVLSSRAPRKPSCPGDQGLRGLQVPNPRATSCLQCPHPSLLAPRAPHSARVSRIPLATPPVPDYPHGMAGVQSWPPLSILPLPRGLIWDQGWESPSYSEDMGLYSALSAPSLSSSPALTSLPPHPRGIATLTWKKDLPSLL